MKRPTFAFVIINALFMAAGAAIAAWTLFPVFGSARFTSVAAIAIAAGAAIALVCERLRWSGYAAFALALAVYVAGGLTLAIPGVGAGTTSVATGLVQLARGPVTGWKDLVTLPLPLGEYGATLVPIFALLLVGTLLSTRIAITSPRRWGFAAVLSVWMVVTAIIVGPATRATPLPWAPFGVYVNREFLVGLAAFAVLLSWFGWRTAYARRRAIANTAGGARLATPPRVRAISAIAAAVVMLGVAVPSAAIIAGPVAADTPRQVARTVIDPQLLINSTVTPLAGYRTYFADDTFNEVLFTVKVTSGDVSRVRLATLPYFDGDEFTAAPPEGTVPTRFERVPSAIEAPETSRPVSAEVTIRSATGVWLPLVGRLGSVSFEGGRAGELVDGFYYQPDTLTGLLTTPGGVAASDSYTLNSYVPINVPALENLGAAPGGVLINSALIPTSLSDWVTRQAVTRDGAGLATLVERLRERGYLSHALIEADGSTQWEAALGDYTFAGAAAGHSYDRIDRLFTELSDRESEVASLPGASLVAAVGDDEQFAVAVALMAADLGFPSRVVLGARLTDTDPSGWAESACGADGSCRGQNMSVWTEVQSASGVWVPVDVTPQHTTPPSPEVTQQQDPKFASDVDPRRAQPISPPSSQRGSASDQEPPVADSSGVWTWLAPVLRAAGISLLAVMVLVGPLLAIVVWKALRRRRRRRAEPQDAIHHGWDEYVDNAVDAGLPPLPLATRREAAAAYLSPNGERLAELTDRATFAGTTVEAEDAKEFWSLVAAERATWLAGKGAWGRLRMRLSLRSVWHSVANQAPEAVPDPSANVVRWRPRERTGK